MTSAAEGHVGSAADESLDAPQIDEVPPTYGEDLREAAVELWQFREMLYQLTQPPKWAGGN